MDDKMFDLLEKMYVEMKEGFKEVNIRIENVENKVIIIEQEHGKKLDVLFDGYKQNADKLDRIENEVSKHDERKNRTRGQYY